MNTEVHPLPLPSTWRQFHALTKPRVIQLIVFCALIGMVLAVPGLPSWPQVRLAAIACLGIWLVAGAAAAFNCVVEQHIDAKMKRTAWRPTAKGELTNWQTLTFSAALCAVGSAILWFWYGLSKRDRNIYLPCIGWAALDAAVIVGAVVYG